MPVLRRITAVLGGSTVLLLTAATVVEAAAPDLQWTQALPGRQSALLEDVDSGAGATWAVGFDLVNDDFTNTHPLTMLRQGDKWTVVPQPVRTSASLNAVEVVSANDVWAVGDDRKDQAETQPLVLHWNGTSWRRVPGPAVPFGSLSDVKVAPDGSVWVSGWARVGTKEPAVVYRYANGSWEALTAGIEDAVNANTLTVLSSNDAWVGTYGGASALAHFDGTSWTPAKDIPLYATPTALEAVAPNDIWMAGVDHNSGVPTGSSLLMHYDGKSWTRIAAPAVSAQLYDLTIRAGRPIAVGESFDGVSPSKPLVLQYDGTRFVTATPPTGDDGTLTGVAVDGNRLWTVGDVFATKTRLDAYAAYSG